MTAAWQKAVIEASAHPVAAIPPDARGAGGRETSGWLRGYIGSDAALLLGVIRYEEREGEPPGYSWKLFSLGELLGEPSIDFPPVEPGYLNTVKPRRDDANEMAFREKHGFWSAEDPR